MTSIKKRVCPATASWTLDNFFRTIIHSPARIVGPSVSPGDTVLDIGCGSGFFTRAMARMVGNDGMVIAVDLQEEMLAKVRERAGREGLLPRIRTVKAAERSLNIATAIQADFALAFYVMHEVQDKERLLREAANALMPGGTLLLVEPKIHVSAKEFRVTVGLAQHAGFRVISRPFILFSRAVLLEKVG